MEVLGYIGAVIIGLTMGLLGGGGSVLGVPILVYLMGVSPILSTAYSLFIVGTTAGIGLVGKIKEQRVNYKIGIIFGLPSLVMVYMTRRFILPMIPDLIAISGVGLITKDLLIMELFALLMLVAAFVMIRKKTYTNSEPKEFGWKTVFIIMIEGAVVGFLTGMVGAGGGFLIIPALVILFGLDMKMAVGTSLFIIMMKSLVGFIGDLQVNQNIDWPFLLTFTALSILGIIIGNWLTRYISSKGLKSIFGYFVLVLAVFIIIKEIVL